MPTPCRPCPGCLLCPMVGATQDPVFIPLGGLLGCHFVHGKKLSQLDEPSVYAAWRAQCLRRLAGPVFTPLGGSSIYAAWRVQCFRRLTNPAFTPLGEPSIYAAWRVQCLRRLESPVITPLGGPSVYAAWRVQYLRRLAAFCRVRRSCP